MIITNKELIMSTPHNAAEKGQIAKVVLMPGDPLRAKFIAETFLENPVQFNDVRGMLGFTGTYKGKEISVMGHGMGIPSIGIYSHELYDHYDVDCIIRIGSAGATVKELKLYDVVLASSSFSNSTYAKELIGTEGKVLEAQKDVNKIILDAAKELNIPVTEGRVASSDVFYAPLDNTLKECEEYNIVAVEMEFFALLANATKLNKKAACLLTISDHILNHEVTSAKERQLAFTNMMKIALDSAINL